MAPYLGIKDNGRRTFVVLGSGVAVSLGDPKAGLLVLSTSRDRKKDRSDVIGCCPIDE